LEKEYKRLKFKLVWWILWKW